MTLEIAVVLLIVFLAMLAILFKMRGDKYLSEAEKQTSEMELEQRKEAAKVAREIFEATQRANARANEVERENNSARDTKPSGEFGDPRL
jgi:hypothetical protein